MSGYKAGFNNYSIGSVTNELEYYRHNTELSLQFELSYTANFYEINKKKQIEFVDFLVFVLGMMAGLAFVTRLFKHALELCNICNACSNDLEILEEEKTKTEMKLDEKALEMVEEKVEEKQEA